VEKVVQNFGLFLCVISINFPKKTVSPLAKFHPIWSPRSRCRRQHFFQKEAACMFIKVMPQNLQLAWVIGIIMSQLRICSFSRLQLHSQGLWQRSLGDAQSLINNADESDAESLLISWGTCLWKMHDMTFCIFTDYEIKKRFQNFFQVADCIMLSVYIGMNILTRLWCSMAWSQSHDF
jgi:hypothetical protein